MIYWDFRKWIYIDIRNPFKTMKKLKGVFKPLKCYFKWNIKDDWFPLIWCSQPAYLHIMSLDVGWKDKFASPRYEYPPAIWIHLFKLNMVWYWELPNEKYMDDYWEQALWYLKYTSYNKEKKGYDPLDINKARDTWPWQDFETNKSSWNDNYLV